MMNPTKCRIVLYRLSQSDVDAINSKGKFPSRNYNPIAAGQQYPAMVVASFGGSAANLQVFLDGDCQHWATSRCEGTGDGTWCWPPRETTKVGDLTVDVDGRPRFLTDTAS